MGFVQFDRVSETTTTTGTGDITTTGAVDASTRAFSAVMSVGDQFPYYITEVDGNGQPDGDFEAGIGEYTGANTIARRLVTESSNGNALVNFGVGDKTISIGPTAFSNRPAALRVGAKTGTAEDLDALDAGTYQRYTNAAAKSLSILDQASGDYPDDARWIIRVVGGALSVVPVSGVQVNSAGDALEFFDGAMLELVKISDENFDLIIVDAGIGHGDAFPESPVANQRFYRTDRNIEYFYDGTRWLSTQLVSIEVANQNVTSDKGVFVAKPFKGTYDLWFDSWSYAMRVNTTATWVLSIESRDNNSTLTTFDSVSTSGQTAGNLVGGHADISALVESNTEGFYLLADEQSGTAIFYGNVTLNFRLVG